MLKLPYSGTICLESYVSKVKIKKKKTDYKPESIKKEVLRQFMSKRN